MSPSTGSVEQQLRLYTQLSHMIDRLLDKVNQASIRLGSIQLGSQIISSTSVNITQTQINTTINNLDRVEDKTKSWAENMIGATEKIHAGFSKLNRLFGERLSLQSMAKSAGDMQGLQQRIKGLPQQFCDSADGIYYLTQQANKARMPVLAFGDAYVNLAKNTKGLLDSPAQVTATLNAMSNALRLGTGNTEEQSVALAELTKGFGKGALDGEKMSAFFNQLSEDTLAKMAAAMGKNKTQLMEMAAQGQITGAQLATSLQSIAPGFQQNVDKMPMSWGTAVTKVSNRWDELLFNLENKSGIITRISNLFIRGFDLAERAIYGFIQHAGGVDNALALIASAIGLLSVGKVVSFFTSLIEIFQVFSPLLPLLKIGLSGLGMALRFMISPAGLVVAAIGAIIFIIKDLYDWINGGDSIIGNFLGPWTAVKTQLLALWEEIKLRLFAIWEEVKNYFLALVPSIISPFITIAAGISTIFDGLCAIVMGVADIIYGVFTFDLDKILSGFTGITSGAQTIFDGFITYLSGLTDLIIAPFKNGYEQAIKWLNKIPYVSSLMGTDNELALTDANIIANVSPPTVVPDTLSKSFSTHVEANSSNTINMTIHGNPTPDQLQKIKNTVVQGTQQGSKNLIRELEEGQS